MLKETGLFQLKIDDRNIIVRLIGSKDLDDYSDEFIKLLSENYSTNFPRNGDLSNHALESYNDMIRFCKDGSALVLGVFSDVCLVGFLWAYKRIFLGEPRLHISHIVVHSNYRGQGIGTKLIHFLEEVATEKKIKIIELLTSSENTAAVSFYKTCGYQVTRVQFEKDLGIENDHK